MVLCVGEILADMIGRERDGVTEYDRYAGGAPFNVACGVARLGGNSGFIGRVGDDIIGRWLKAYAGTRGFGYTDVQVDRSRNTTLAFVELSPDGERNFCFYRKGTADYHIEGDFAAAVQRADIVHVGSLALSEPAGRAYVDALFAAAEKAGKRISFDMNYRADLFDGPDALRPYIERAHIVKLSEDEAAMLGGAQTAVRRLSFGRLVAVTLGAKGSAYCLDGEYVRVPGISVRPVDTTGAGDAFYAGLLFQLDGGMPYTPERLYSAFTFANVCGALATTARGAVTALPEPNEVKKYLDF